MVRLILSEKELSMKKCIATAVFTILISPSLYGMKRTIAADLSQPNKKCKVATALEPASLERSVAFDSFMILHKMNRYFSEQEAQYLRQNFVVHNVVDHDSQNALLLKRYYDIMWINQRMPRKIIGDDNTIVFL